MGSSMWLSSRSLYVITFLIRCSKSFCETMPFINENDRVETLTKLAIPIALVVLLSCH